MKIKVLLLLIGAVCSFTALNAQCELTGPEFSGHVLINSEGNCCVKVRPLAPVAQIDCQQQGCIGYWDWGDGNITNDPCGAVYCYDCPGEYTITHYVEGFGYTSEMTFDLTDCNDEDCVEEPDCIDIQHTHCLMLNGGSQACYFCAFINIAQDCDVAQVLTTVSYINSGDVIYTTTGYYIAVLANSPVEACTQVLLTDGTQFEYCETFYEPCEPGLVGQDPTEETYIETNLSDKITITPNPFSDYISIRGFVSDEAIQIIELINIQGQIIKREQLSIHDHQFDTSSLNPGLYLLRITSEDGKQIHTRRLIKP